MAHRLPITLGREGKQLDQNKGDLKNEKIYYDIIDGSNADGHDPGVSNYVICPEAKLRFEQSPVSKRESAIRE